MQNANGWCKDREKKGGKRGGLGKRCVCLIFFSRLFRTKIILKNTGKTFGAADSKERNRRKTKRKRDWASVGEKEKERWDDAQFEKVKQVARGEGKSFLKSAEVRVVKKEEMRSMHVWSREAKGQTQTENVRVRGEDCGGREERQICV